MRANRAGPRTGSIRLQWFMGPGSARKRQNVDGFRVIFRARLGLVLPRLVCVGMPREEVKRCTHAVNLTMCLIGAYVYHGGRLVWPLSSPGDLDRTHFAKRNSWWGYRGFEAGFGATTSWGLFWFAATQGPLQDPPSKALAKAGLDRTCCHNPSRSPRPMNADRAHRHQRPE